ncbi:hypothetical protein J7K18_02480 [bacterium]|nr:hypothetical protein [bacterium]
MKKSLEIILIIIYGLIPALLTVVCGFSIQTMVIMYFIFAVGITAFYSYQYKNYIKKKEEL